MKRWKASAAIPWVSAPMAGNGERKGSNALPWPIFMVDIDQVSGLQDKSPVEVLFEFIHAVRQIAPCFGYTTASHTDEEPRARLVLHLSRPVNTAEARAIGAVLSADLSKALNLRVGSSKSVDVLLDLSMQDAAHIAFSRLAGSQNIRLSESAPPLDVDAFLIRAPFELKRIERTDRLALDVGRAYSQEARQAVVSALDRLDKRHPQAVNDRVQWLRVLAALKSHGWPDQVMEPIARQWSMTSFKFDEERWNIDWNSLKVEGGITPATLYYLSGQADDECPAFGTDDGFACRFCAFLDGRAMYARGGWYAWAGTHWQSDSVQVAVWLKQFARQQADDLARLFHADPSDKGKEARLKAARQLLQQNVQDRVLRAAATMLRVDDADLDRDLYLLACSNGTVDLRTGGLKSPEPNDRITRCTGHAFDAAAASSAWEAFIAEALGDSETLDWFQRFIGYSATGDVREEKMLLALGPSGTGKSTALKAIMNSLGGETASTSYCTAAASALLSDTGKRRSASEHTGGLTPLVGKRLAAVNEIKRGEAWDDSLFKQLVSREPIQMREVGGARAFNVIPTWKVWVRGNHRPNIRDVTDAFFRRVAVLEFKRKPVSADHGLDERLRAEATGILAWIVRGAIKWQERGLVLPPVMRAALDSYRSEQDMFGEWLATRVEPGGFSEGHMLRRDYAEFAGLTRHPPTDKAFAAMMRERGYEPKKYRGRRGFSVVFVPDRDDPFDPSSLV